MDRIEHGIAVVPIIGEIQNFKFQTKIYIKPIKNVITRSFTTFYFTVESYCEICKLQHFENTKYIFIKELKGNHKKQS